MINKPTEAEIAEANEWLTAHERCGSIHISPGKWNWMIYELAKLLAANRPTPKRSTDR